MRERQDNSKSIASNEDVGQQELATPGRSTPASRRYGGSDSLDPAVSAKMGASMGADFSGVKVKKDQPIAAQAQAKGSTIQFAPGKYQPGTRAGQELIGHELAHVVQQAEGRVAPTTQAKGGSLVNADPALEAEADRWGARAARGEQVRQGPLVNPAHGAVAQLKPNAAPNQDAQQQQQQVNDASGNDAAAAKAVRRVLTVGKTRCLVLASAELTGNPDVFVFFHGYRADYKLDGNKQKSNWKESSVVPAATAAMTGKKNAVAILPQGHIGEGGKISGGHQSDLRKNGLPFVIDGVLGQLDSQDGKGLTPGRISIAGHSAGGYQGVGPAMKGAGAYSDNITDVTLMDAGYSSSNPWKSLHAWMFQGKPNKRILIIWTGAQSSGKHAGHFNRGPLMRAATKNKCSVKMLSTKGDNDARGKVIQRTHIINEAGGLQCEVVLVLTKHSHKKLKASYMADAMARVGQQQNADKPKTGEKLQQDQQQQADKPQSQEQNAQEKVEEEQEKQEQADANKEQSNAQTDDKSAEPNDSAPPPPPAPPPAGGLTPSQQGDSKAQVQPPGTDTKTTSTTDGPTPTGPGPLTPETSGQPGPQQQQQNQQIDIQELLSSSRKRKATRYNKWRYGTGKESESEWKTTSSQISNMQQSVGAPATGQFNDDTAQAIANKQEKQGGLAVDGMVGPNTQEVVNLRPESPGTQKEQSQAQNKTVPKEDAKPETPSAPTPSADQENTDANDAAQNSESDDGGTGAKTDNKDQQDEETPPPPPPPPADDDDDLQDGANAGGDQEKDAAMKGTKVDPMKIPVSVEPPEKMSQYNVQKKLRSAFDERFKKGANLYHNVFKLNVTEYRSKTNPDPEAPLHTSLDGVWQALSVQLSEYNFDVRKFKPVHVLKTTSTKGNEIFIRMRAGLSRGKVDSKMEQSIIKSLDKVDPSHAYGGSKRHRLAPETYEAYKALYAAVPAEFKAEIPSIFKIKSSFRSKATQESSFAKRVEKERKADPTASEATLQKRARKWVAAPGSSAHNTGHAVDLDMGWGLSSSKAKQMTSKKGALYDQYGKYWEWLLENAPNYGFLPYYAEPWHWEKWK